MSIKPEKNIVNFLNVSEVFHEIFQSKKIMKFYITMCNITVKGRPSLRSSIPIPAILWRKISKEKKFFYYLTIGPLAITQLYPINQSL